MAETFDPYRMWLGIPATEQPPNHYRLLGVGLFESDADVISNAADRQMVHVRTFQGGKYSALSQRVLNELSTARISLLDPKRKAEYDDQLRKQMASKVAVLRPVAVPPVPVPAAVTTPTPLVVPRPAVVPVAAPVSAAPVPKTAPAPPISPPAAHPAVFVPKPARPVAGAAAGQPPSTAWQIPVIVGLLVLLALVAAIYWLSQSGGSDTKTSGTLPVRHASGGCLACGSFISFIDGGGPVRCGEEAGGGSGKVEGAAAGRERHPGRYRAGPAADGAAGGGCQ